MKKRTKGEDNYYLGNDSYFIISTLPFVGFYSGEMQRSENTQKKAKLTDDVYEASKKCGFKSKRDANELCGYLNENFCDYRFGVVEVDLRYVSDERSDRKLYNSF